MVIVVKLQLLCVVFAYLNLDSSLPTTVADLKTALSAIILINFNLANVVEFIELVGVVDAVDMVMKPCRRCQCGDSA